MNSMTGIKPPVYGTGYYMMVANDITDRFYAPKRMRSAGWRTEQAVQLNCDHMNSCVKGS